MITTMILLSILIVAGTAVGIVYARHRRAEAAKPRSVTLYTRNGYAQAAQVPPLNTYVQALGRAPRTLAEAELAGWFLARSAAAEYEPAVVPPPFGGEAPKPSALVMWQISGTVAGAELVPGTWSRITLVEGYLTRNA